MHTTITSDSDRFEQFLEAFYSINTEIAGHAVKLSEMGLQCEVFMWYGILIEAHLSLYLAVYEELIFEVGEVYSLPLRSYIPDEIDVFREKYTLGKLVKRFSKISGQPSLNKKLEAFNRDRNKIVHRFIDSGYSLKETSKFKKNNDQTFLLIYELQEEFNSLLREAARVKGVRIKQLDSKLKAATEKAAKLRKEICGGDEGDKP